VRVFRELRWFSEPHQFARCLRRTATRAEDMLWERLRGSRLACTRPFARRSGGPGSSVMKTSPS
jgi:very-short-patch-repair endonuclease